MTDTTITATITPSATSSKIFIIVTFAVKFLRDTNAPMGCNTQVLRGASVISGYIGNLEFQMGTDTSGRAALRLPWAWNYLDSPNTTSATTYKVQAAAGTTSNNGQVIAQSNNMVSNITLMEIGA